jgi:hypothetical protein
MFSENHRVWPSAVVLGTRNNKANEANLEYVD